MRDLAAAVAAAADPVVVAGDFNITPWSPHFKDLLAATGLRHAARGGHTATWPRRLGAIGIPIDHVLLRGAVTAVDLARGPATGSDHFPLVANLRLLDD